METREVRFDVSVAWRSTTDSSITWWSCPPGTRVADRCFSAGGRASMEEAQNQLVRWVEGGLSACVITRPFC